MFQLKVRPALYLYSRKRNVRWQFSDSNTTQRCAPNTRGFIVADLKAALRGTTYTHKESANTVSDVPDNFKQWVKDHIEAQKGRSSTPYFIRDNFKNGDLSKGLKIALPIAQQVDVLAPYQAQIAQARQMASKWGLSIQLAMLDKYVGDKDIASIQSRIATTQSKAAQIADIRRKCAEWGLNTYILDEAMRSPDSKNILAKMAELEDRCFEAEKDYKKFIADATNTIQEARKYKINVSGMLNDIATITGDKCEWVMCKSSYKKALQDFLDKIAQSKGVNPTKLDGIIQEIEKDGVEYRNVAKLAQISTDDEIIERVGGGDKTSGSCASLALAFTANKMGLDVLDFRGGKSWTYFSSRLNLYHICEKVGGYTSLDITGPQLLKQTEVGKTYYVAWARHAAVVRQTSKGKYEYLELQSATNNGWKPLDSKTMNWRFGDRGRDVGILMDIELLQKDSGFPKMMGYINTAEVDQKKGKSGTIK